MMRDVQKLFERQRRSWPLLARGLEGLAQARTRRMRIDWFDVFIRHIPHRMASTTALVDPGSVARRACFLCADNLPPEEEGLPFDDEFILYCNPFPIVDYHLTIAHREHRPQRIAGQVGKMLDLAAALPEYFVIYNGPECGASAPDHLHFQAGLRNSLPIAQETGGLTGITVPNYSRNVFLLRGTDRRALIERLDRAIGLLGDSTNKPSEPLVNIAMFYEERNWTVYLFPRSKHRPEVFYRGELTVSPAAIDLCGIFVVPLAQDFERITGDQIAAIFREVTLSNSDFYKVAARLEREP